MKSCKRPLWASVPVWLLGAALLLPFCVSPQQAIGGLLLFEGIFGALTIGYLWIYNRIELDDREVRIINALGRVRRYRYDDLRQVELLNDMRTQPRIRLTPCDDERRWFHLEGIRTKDYRIVAEEFERHGVPVETHRMEHYLGRAATGVRRPSSSGR
ncbi:MAG: hypothetical protein K2K30_03065 [Alistipes sp.]|nr:hypothetical protein [Alistipes sp.]